MLPRSGSPLGPGGRFAPEAERGEANGTFMVAVPVMRGRLMRGRFCKVLVAAECVTAKSGIDYLIWNSGDSGRSSASGAIQCWRRPDQFPSVKSGCALVNSAE